jgi:hypothetical protein
VDDLTRRSGSIWGMVTNGWRSEDRRYEGGLVMALRFCGALFFAPLPAAKIDLWIGLGGVDVDGGGVDFEVD